MIIKCAKCDTNNIVNIDALTLTRTVPYCGTCNHQLAVQSRLTKPTRPDLVSANQPPNIQINREVHTR